ncbi:hypothetical protein [Gordonia aichiensis]|uniref:hypothetical protein n=1 Tax=Gordonia aichiensis TaxID=36820 RepID=UPI0032652988
MSDSTPRSGLAPPSPREDVRDLLGMRAPRSLPVVGAYLLSMIVVAVSQIHVVTDPVLLFGGLLVFIAAALGVVLIDGDPLPHGTTLLLTAAGPLGCALVLAGTPAIPSASLLFTWIHGAGTVVYCFLNVRGRLIAPWVGLAAMVVVAAVWAHLRNLSPMTAGLLVGVDAAPIIMSLLFALTLRPAARRVFALRRRTLDHVASASAEVAATEERGRQAHRLNALARPMLQRIAVGGDLTDDERRSCAMLEAHLRDQIRAPLLAQLGLDVSAYHARTRGVDVLLIDDTRTGRDRSVSEDLSPPVLSVLQQTATDALDHALDGDVVVRVSAPDRPIAASVLVRSSAGTTRSEIASDGDVTDHR